MKIARQYANNLFDSIVGDSEQVISRYDRVLREESQFVRNEADAAGKQMWAVFIESKLRRCFGANDTAIPVEERNEQFVFWSGTAPEIDDRADDGITGYFVRIRNFR